MNEMELVELFGVIAPTLRAEFVPCTSVEFLILLKLKNVSSCPTAIMRTCMPCRWWWALAFRIDTSGAATVRNALLERLCRRKEKQVLLVSMNNRMPNEC